MLCLYQEEVIYASSLFFIAQRSTLTCLPDTHLLFSSIGRVNLLISYSAGNLRTQPFKTLLSPSFRDALPRPTMAFSYYEYLPSKAAAIIACLIFIIITILHTWQLFRTRTWFFIPFVIGGLCQCSPSPSLPPSY